MPALPPNSLIAITGITGYIASYAGLEALRAGYRVRGTVRSLARAEALKAAYEKQGIPTTDLASRLEFVFVDDLSSEEQWFKAIEGVDGVIHAAFALTRFRDPQIILEALEVTLSLLRAAKKVPSVKRVVYTSSSTAVVTAPMYRDKALTGEDWNEDVVRIVEKKEPVDQDPILKRASAFFFYATGKVRAEQAAWEFVKNLNEKTHFDLVSILPNTNFGPMLHGEPASTASWISGVLKGDTSLLEMVPAQWHVDVRDCGRLHLLALTTPSMGGKRFWAAAEPYGWNAIFAIVRKHFPYLKVPEDFEAGGLDRQKIDNGPATELLGGWISLEQSIVDLVKSLGY